MSRAAVVATLLSLLSIAVVHAQDRTGRDFPVGLDIDLDYSYYEVHGRTAREIHESMRAGGPQVDGSTFFALTGVETGFRYRHVQDGAICRLEDVGVQAHVVMRLPKWTGAEAASIQLGESWDDFVQRLIRHEAEHYRIIEGGTRRIYNTLVDLHAHSCSVLETRANQAIRDMSDMQASENERLDLDTDHGAYDGAVWPPSDFVVMP